MDIFYIMPLSMYLYIIDTVRGSEATALEPGSDNQQQQHSSSSQAESYTKLHQLAVQHFRQVSLYACCLGYCL